MSKLLVNTANCGIMADYFKEQGHCLAYTDTPQVGDIAAFDWNGNHTKRHHVGLVVEVRNGGDTVVTIEGNTAVGNDSNGGQVMERTRYRSQVTCWLRPDYKSEYQRTAIIARARGELGVKEAPYGSNKVKYNTWFYGKAVSGSDYPWCAVFICWVFNGPENDDTGKNEEVSCNYGKELTVTVNQLQVGHFGPEVKTVQRILYARGIKGADGKAVKVDGEFGANTEAATIALQKQLFPENSAEWDGVWGAKTWTAALTALW